MLARIEKRKIERCPVDGKKKNHFFVFMAILVAVVAISVSGLLGGGSSLAQAPQVPVGGTLRIAGAFGIDSLDPAETYYAVTWSILDGVYRRGFTFDAAGQIVPDLFVSLGESNADSTEFTFVLKSNILFGPINGVVVPGVTGTEITAWDMKAGIERSLHRPVKPFGPTFYLGTVIEGVAEYQKHPQRGISGIEIPDTGDDGDRSNDRTIIFHLVKPTGDLPYRLALFVATPTRGSHPGLPPATGPYYIAKSVPNRSLRLERNSYWDPATETDGRRKAYPDHVEITWGIDEEEGIQQILDGTFDLAIDFAPQGETLVALQGDTRLIDGGTAGAVRYGWFDVRYPPFNSVLVRRAVNYAINRMNVQLAFSEGNEAAAPLANDIATSFIPPDTNGGFAPQEFNPYEAPEGNLTKALELMAEAGFSEGFHEHLALVTSEDSRNAEVGKEVREALMAIGFTDVDLVLVGRGDMYGLYNDPDIHLSMGLLFGSGSAWGWDFPEGLSFIEPLFSSASIGPESCCNYGSVTALEEEIGAAQALPIGDARTEAIEELNRTVTGRDALDPLVDTDENQALVVPLLWSHLWAVRSDRAVNVQFNKWTGIVEWYNTGVES